MDLLAKLLFKYILEIFNHLENANIDIEKLDSLAKIHRSLEQLVSFISLIPLLFKTYLLIFRQKSRQKVLNYTFMKRCILKDHTVGN